ncbi:Spermidine/putrescine-binding periplasmic protein precursor [Acholeplasma oculi]|uniref:Spermidine/Putrescine ABC transporter, periplasmic-binding protein PotD n=1 Tax=Acholeplasma oculi TaxID=35623 RepID=A0A061AI86_9MOLU|nr:extracellular solute-binding protein [Acholeplasma oculi]CDR31311.1 Spermidine/Putrescine ABC transporter, periplasmic-binding protein PotD [Acholeplasma oculi]SKC38929.1 spermidine/putrescine transport system substrate-binding protein [Acholeplasma oculi]SUT91575.1 Spermidine/putrescine-binding periplasmic protein precursor [Acholeplasma oculi]
MKKLFMMISLLLVTVILNGCTTNQKLLILNWGEYINEDLVILFEETYNVEVSISIADSNELFYSKIKSGTTAFDLVLPSDYMIEKMKREGLIQKIDFTKLSHYDRIDNPYMKGLEGIMSTMTEGSDEYFVPYFWGTFGLMYNRRITGLETALETHGWQAYFNPDLRPTNRVGMYDVAQYAYAAALLSHNLDPNGLPDDIQEGQTKTNITLAKETLVAANFQVFADDALKKDIQANNLDLAFVWTGDFLDMLYVDLDEGMAYDEKLYDIYIPENTMAFMDAFVIPTKARNTDLAHLFIDFFLDPANAYENASVVGYSTPLYNTYLEITTYEGDDEWLNNWSRAYLDYYPDSETFRGTPYASFEQSVMAQLNLMLNDVKTT